MCADDVVLDMSPSALLCVGGVPKSHSADAISASALLHTNGHVVAPPDSVTQRRRGSDRSAGTDVSSSVSNKQQSRRARLGRQLRTGRFWLRLLQPWKWRAHAAHKTQPSLDALNGGTIVLTKRKRLSPIKKVWVCVSLILFTIYFTVTDASEWQCKILCHSFTDGRHSDNTDSAYHDGGCTRTQWQ